MALYILWVIFLFVMYDYMFRTFAGQVCMAPVCKIMVDNDKMYTSPFDYRSKYNIMVKQELYTRWFSTVLKCIGMIVDTNAGFNLGVYPQCVDTHCNMLKHKHTLMVYVNTRSN